jgi:hypothetical protein
MAAEIKTTFPYQPGFGAKQREMISKDIEELKKSDADVKFLFLTEQQSFEAAKKIRAWKGSGIRVVLLPRGKEFVLWLHITTWGLQGKWWRILLIFSRLSFLNSVALLTGRC